MLIVAIIVAALIVAFAVDAAVRKIGDRLKSQAASLRKIADRLEELERIVRAANRTLEDEARFKSDVREKNERATRLQEAKELRDGIANGTIRSLTD